MSDRKARALYSAEYRREYGDVNRDTLQIEYGTGGKASRISVNIDPSTAAYLADALNEYAKQLRADAALIKTALVKP